MTILESIFVCNNSKDDDDDIREIKEQLREIKSEMKSIWREIDIRVEVCNNKSMALQSSIDLKFDLMNTKIDNLIVLIQSKK